MNILVLALKIQQPALHFAFVATAAPVAATPQGLFAPRPQTFCFVFRISEA